MTRLNSYISKSQTSSLRMSSDSMVNVWKVETKEHVYALPGHRGTVTDVTFHPTEPVIASCRIDGQIYLGELEL